MEKSPLRERASTSVNVTVGRGSRGKHSSRRVNRRCRSCDADMAPNIEAVRQALEAPSEALIASGRAVRTWP
jgi:hypothetical protein